jgi:hypothetical protein
MYEAVVEGTAGAPKSVSGIENAGFAVGVIISRS